MSDLLPPLRRCEAVTGQRKQCRRMGDISSQYLGQPINLCAQHYGKMLASDEIERVVSGQRY